MRRSCHGTTAGFGARGAAAIALTAAALTVGTAAGGTAQTASAPLPPVHPLGRIEKRSAPTLANIAEIRPLSDGRVLANDMQDKRVVLFDSSLAGFLVVADTSTSTARAYGPSEGTLFPFRGDSSLFADWASSAFMVIDPSGRLGRVMAAPTRGPAGLLYLISAAVDPAGNVVSLWTAPELQRLGRAVGARPTAAPARDTAVGALTITRDSSAIVRVNIESRRMDSAAWLTPRVTTMVNLPNVAGSGHTVVPVRLSDPMPATDLWTMLPDGTIAVVRELDYHIDWFAPDGTRRASPRIAHQWERITDSMKSAIMDSVKRSDSVGLVRNRAFVDSLRRANGARSGGSGAGSGSGSGGAGSGSGGETHTVTTGPSGAASVDGQAPQYIDPSDLPDYFPPFSTADSLGNVAVRSDADGNLWIHVSRVNAPGGGPVYDVVNRQGVLIDRIQIPGGTKLVGFGPGVAYLTARVGTGYQLARARIH